MAKPKKDLLPWLKEKGYQYVQKFNDQMFICTKEKEVTSESLFDEYKIYKTEFLDIPDGILMKVMD